MSFEIALLMGGIVLAVMVVNALVIFRIFKAAQNSKSPKDEGGLLLLQQQIQDMARAIDSRTGVFASKVTPGVIGEKPVRIEMIDAKTKELVEVLEVDACMVATGRVPFTDSLALGAAGVEKIGRAHV
jgi:hypothetical protein